ncbi:MAG: DUF5654 family protein [bacterium]|nr:DUF5654 family protein [bacterium]
MNNIDLMKEKLTSGAKAVRREIRKKVLTYIVAGLGFVAGLAWNDAIRSLISFLLPDLGDTVSAKIIYALALTLVVAVILIYLDRLLRSGDSSQDKK